MKQALISIVIISIAGLVFSTGITLFGQSLKTLGLIGNGKNESSVVAYR